MKYSGITFDILMSLIVRISRKTEAVITDNIFYAGHKPGQGST